MLNHGARFEVCGDANLDGTGGTWLDEHGPSVGVAMNKSCRLLRVRAVTFHVKKKDTR